MVINVDYDGTLECAGRWERWGRNLGPVLLVVDNEVVIGVIKL
jgi:hypothetical protein